VSGTQRFVIEVDDDSFDAALVADDRSVVVEFTATWCGPCKRLAPVLEQFAEKHADSVRVIAVDADASPVTTARFGVTSLPTLMLFRGGEPLLFSTRAEEALSADFMAAIAATDGETGWSPAAADPAFHPVSRGERTLVFPDKAVADVTLTYIPFRPNAERITAETRGEQRVPAGCMTLLQVGDFDGTGVLPELAHLGGLAPDAIDSLVVVASDFGRQALERVRHLSGLRKLTLLRAPEPSVSVFDVAAAFSELRSLGFGPTADGVRLDDESIARVQAAHPALIVNNRWRSSRLRHVDLRAGA